MGNGQGQRRHGKDVFSKQTSIIISRDVKSINKMYFTTTDQIKWSVSDDRVSDMQKRVLKQTQQNFPQQVIPMIPILMLQQLQHINIQCTNRRVLYSNSFTSLSRDVILTLNVTRQRSFTELVIAHYSSFLLIFRTHKLSQLTERKTDTSRHKLHTLHTLFGQYHIHLQ